MYPLKTGTIASKHCIHACVSMNRIGWAGVFFFIWTFAMHATFVCGSLLTEKYICRVFLWNSWMVKNYKFASIKASTFDMRSRSTTHCASSIELKSAQLARSRAIWRVKNQPQQRWNINALPVRTVRVGNRLFFLRVCDAHTWCTIIEFYSFGWARRKCFANRISNFVGDVIVVGLERIELTLTLGAC